MICRKCAVLLTIENTSPSRIRRSDYECRNCYNSYAKEHRKTNKNYILTQRIWRLKNIEKINQQRKIHTRQRKKKIVDYYGGKCFCCGETRLEFLTIDHINGGGNKHRKSLFGAIIGGDRFYNWLIKQGFPEGYRTACWNCNCARRMNNGVCPHQLNPIIKPTYVSSDITVNDTQSNPNVKRNVV